MKLLIHTFLIFISIFTCYSQTHIYKHYGVDEGLPSSEVYDIYQDKLGYIWFATDKGISRYNGYEFENFNTENGLPGNTILDFYPQPNGEIWCYDYHSQKLFYFNEIVDGFKSYKYNDLLKKQLSPISVIKSIVIDNENNLFAGGLHIYGLIEVSSKGKINHLYNSSLEFTKSYEARKTTLGISKSKGFFSAMDDYTNEKDVVFIKTKTSISSRLDLITLNDEQKVLINQKLGILINHKINYIDSHQNPIGIERINDELFFVGYYANGAEIRDVSGRIFEKFLPNKSVSNFLIDKEGSYWFTTIDDGVFYIKNPNIKVYSEDHISSLVKDHKNILYAGYKNGDIGSVSTKKTNLIYKGLKNDNALIEFDNVNNQLYGYGDSKLINFKTYKTYNIGASKLPEIIGDSLLTSSRNKIYFKQDGITTFKKYKFKVQDVCNYNQTTLIGSSTGLYTQNSQTLKKHQPFDILKSRIDDIDLNKNTNTVYMATQGSGVIVYKDSVYNITKANGLTNNIISEIHIENDATIWACSNTGLNKITFKNNHKFNITTITKSDGLLSNDINDIEIINDTVWVATKKGLCYFKKDFLLEKEVSEVLSLTLKKITANKKIIHSNDLKLKYNENNIEFKLQAISHKNTDQINYLYRLKEVDTTWTSTKSRIISFPSLSSGTYTFEAKANIFNNQSNEIVSYTFKILPPYWKSWWFYTLCFLLLSTLVYIFFKIRILTYNKDITRELIRLAIKRLKRYEISYNFRANGEDFKIPSKDILYINSQGNYLDIITATKTHTIRCKIGDFINTTPDSLEYLRVHRSYIVRIDQISSKGRNWVMIKEFKIPVGETYLKELEKIQF